jgi:hypothetical protein
MGVALMSGEWNEEHFDWKTGRNLIMFLETALLLFGSLTALTASLSALRPVRQSSPF